jgi:hypothetical protein
MTLEWKQALIGLGFFAGEIKLFEKRYAGQVCTQHFTQLKDEDLDLRNGSFGRDVNVLLLPVAPLPEKPPPIRFINKWLVYTPHTFKNFYVDLSGNFDSYLNHFSSKSRSLLKRKIRKLSEAVGGTISWAEYRTSSEIRKFYELARQVSILTYQENLLGAGLPKNEQFQKEMIEAADRNEARGFLLFMDKKPIAFLYNSAKDGILFYDHVGYDPDYKMLSPGTVLLYLALKSLFDQKQFRIFDFTEGEGQHKELFATHFKECGKVYFFRKTLSNILLIILHLGTDRFMSTAGRILNGIGIKRALKMSIRKISNLKHKIRTYNE